MKKRTFIPLATGIAMVACSSVVDESGINVKPGEDTKPDPKPEVPELPQHPNILLILVDDLGYSDVGCYGSEISTPNIDRLAEQGIRFRNFYNTARSAPTRASLMTGLYPHQAGCGSLNKVAGYENYTGSIKKSTCTIPEAIKSAGYRSFITGKWHLLPEMPLNRGFDHGLFNGGGWYFSTDESISTNYKALFLEQESIKPGTNGIPAEFYTSDMWVDQGMKWVDEAVSDGVPFFWYLPFNAVHFPVQAPLENINHYVGKYDEGYDAIRNRRWEKQKQMGLFDEGDRLTPRNPHKNNTPWDEMTDALRKKQSYRMAIYAGCVERMDYNVGRAIDHLRELGVLENTVIFFISDNGGNAESGFPGRYETAKGAPGQVGSNVFLGTPWADVANTPFFLYKHHGHQGGCCTPFIMSWQAGIDKSLWGSIDRENYGHVCDIMPTIVELTGGKYLSENNGMATPPMPGTSLVAGMKGKKINRENPVIVEHEGNKMLRDGEWKIVREYELVDDRESTELENPWRLYNLRTDPTEMTDLSAEKPAKLKSMIATYNKWADYIGVCPEIKFNVGLWYVPVREYLAEEDD